MGNSDTWRVESAANSEWGVIILGGGRISSWCDVMMRDGRTDSSGKRTTMWYGLKTQFFHCWSSHWKNHATKICSAHFLNALGDNTHESRRRDVGISLLRVLVLWLVDWLRRLLVVRLRLRLVHGAEYSRISKWYEWQLLYRCRLLVAATSFFNMQTPDIYSASSNRLY